ncbi:MAG: hypothetical protein EOP04_29730 [Proteobacteria bacterium]|nr:MAG: hypothetical protein EOP04_29730 [Pseudomonadota bacterium]
MNDYDDISDAPTNIDKVGTAFVHILLVSPSIIAAWLIAKPFISNGHSPQIAISIAAVVTVLAICHALTMPKTALKEELFPISIALILALIITPSMQQAMMNSKKAQKYLELKMKMEKTRTP